MQGENDHLIHMQNNEIWPSSYIRHKNQLFKDLNIRPETIKILEEKLGGKLHDIHLGSDFLDMTSKS